MSNAVARVIKSDHKCVNHNSLGVNHYCISQLINRTSNRDLSSVALFFVDKNVFRKNGDGSIRVVIKIIYSIK